ncbi:nuclear transport factor 2 family protein [Rhizobium lusitanum]|uniref:Nuclear transport factor 2 family protein n=1 Tax=Rhizobium lusitanum TaxID=293958 RepID=A0A6L9UDH6_9HYPH|nr:nuclear transport factor 2 family protein [Rhizobium lusitanum]NEI74025.1 nuclear transport factor 2 family protein [Rhizobium lusitanum]
MSDEDAIRQIAETYFDAIYKCDANLFAAILHPAAMLYCFADAEPVIMNVETYLEIVRGRVSPETRNDPRKDEIVLIEIPTPTTAHMRVREIFLPKQFTDELTLVKTKDGWKIVSKVWHFTLTEQ